MNRSQVCFFLLAALLCAAMPSAQSLWIDEAQTHTFASQPTFSAWLQKLQNEGKSEALMPLGMLSGWITAQFFGLSEWQLRFPNVLWMWIAVAAFAQLGRAWRTPWAPLVFAVQPFVWFYANEARPYSQQIACSAVMAVAMVRLMDTRTFSPAAVSALLLSANLLIATSLFGVLTAGPAIVIVAALAVRQCWPRPGWVTAAAVSSVGWWLACGAYYLLALARGAKGAKLWDVGWQNIAFSLYEFLGFAGLGPGRNDLRTMARSMGSSGTLADLLPFALPILLLGVLYGAILLSLKNRAASVSAHRPAALAAAGVCGAAILATLGLAFAARFPFWGRHLAPAFPFAALLLVFLLSSPADRGPSWWKKSTGPLLLFTLLTSSLLLRFHPRHAKDDYRSAAQFAHAALDRGQTVWWSADSAAARYYGLALAEHEPQPGSATCFFEAKPERVASVLEPDLIVTTKPEA